MANLSPFCTCDNTACPLHPEKHGRGCAPCIAKNLKLGELPSCFFKKVPQSKNRSGNTFADFAKAVQNTKEND